MDLTCPNVRQNRWISPFNSARYVMSLWYKNAPRQDAGDTVTLAPTPPTRRVTQLSIRGTASRARRILLLRYATRRRRRDDHDDDGAQARVVRARLGACRPRRPFRTRRRPVPRRTGATSVPTAPVSAEDPTRARPAPHRRDNRPPRTTWADPCPRTADATVTATATTATTATAIETPHRGRHDVMTSSSDGGPSSSSCHQHRVSGPQDDRVVGGQNLPVIMATGCRMPRSPSRDKDFVTCARTVTATAAAQHQQQQPFATTAVVLNRVSSSYPEAFFKRYIASRLPCARFARSCRLSISSVSHVALSLRIAVLESSERNVARPVSLDPSSLLNGVSLCTTAFVFLDIDTHPYLDPCSLKKRVRVTNVNLILLYRRRFVWKKTHSPFYISSLFSLDHLIINSLVHI